MKIYQNKISNDKQDSFWYEGLIATNKGWSLYANGEQKFIKSDKKGNYLGMYDGEFRDNFLESEVKDDKDVEKLYHNPDIYVDMNNWFELISDKDSGISEVLDGGYDEAIKQLLEFSK
jgi:hypothetical protein